MRERESNRDVRLEHKPKHLQNRNTLKHAIAQQHKTAEVERTLSNLQFPHRQLTFHVSLRTAREITEESTKQSTGPQTMKNRTEAAPCGRFRSGRDRGTRSFCSFYRATVQGGTTVRGNGARFSRQRRSLTVRKKGPCNLIGGGTAQEPGMPVQSHDV